MTGLFANAIIIASLLLAVWAAALALLNRGLSRWILLAASVLEVMLLAFLIGGIAQMGGARQDLPRAEFIGYLLACAAAVPLALWWVKGEKSRAASVVAAVVFLLMPILVIRVQQVWSGSGV